MKKRLICIVLTMLLLISLVAFPVAAEEKYTGTHSENITWTFDPATGTMTFSGTGTVSGFADGETEWSAYRLQIRHLVIDEGITAISGNVFSKLKIETLKIADSVKTIDGICFDSCDVRYVDLGLGVTYVGSMTFSALGYLETIVLPDSLQTIEGEAFSSSGLKTLALPEGTEIIDNGAFRDNRKLTKVYLPASVTQINIAAFYGCESLTDVYYSGTQAQWEAIEIYNDPGRGNNEDLLAATFHFEHVHSFDEGSVTREATDKQVGVKTYLCRECGAARQEIFYATSEGMNFKGVFPWIAVAVSVALVATGATTVLILKKRKK